MPPKSGFGDPLEGEDLSSWIAKKDANFGDWLSLSLESLREGILPVEMALDQLPARLTSAARHIPFTTGNRRRRTRRSDGLPEKC